MLHVHRETETNVARMRIADSAFATFLNVSPHARIARLAPEEGREGQLLLLQHLHGGNHARRTQVVLAVEREKGITVHEVRPRSRIELYNTTSKNC